MSDNFELVNAYDELVRTQVKQYVEQEDGMCQCEKCFLDTCAFVFNHGYSNFVTTAKGQLMTEIEEATNASRIDLAVTIMDAIRRVKASPLH